MKIVLNGLRHIAYLVKCSLFHLVNHSIVGLQHTCEERSLLCCRVTLTLNLITTRQSYIDVLINNTTLVGYACGVVLSKITLVVLCFSIDTTVFIWVIIFYTIKSIFIYRTIRFGLRRKIVCKDSIIFVNRNKRTVIIHQTITSKLSIFAIKYFCLIIICMPTCYIIVTTRETRTLQLERKLKSIIQFICIFLLQIDNLLIREKTPLVIACIFRKRFLRICLTVSVRIFYALIRTEIVFLSSVDIFTG